MTDRKNTEWKPDSLYYCGLALLAAGLLCYAIFQIPGVQVSRILLPCLFHTLTGFYCPGCGGTRALAALLHGNLAESLHYHPIVCYGAVLYVWYMVSNTIQYVSRGKRNIGMKYRSVYVWIGVVILVLHTIWKNAVLILYGQTL